MKSEKLRVKSLVWAMLLMPLFVYGGTVNTKSIDQLLDIKKNEYLKKYEPNNIKKPEKPNYEKVKSIKTPIKDTYPKLALPDKPKKKEYQSVNKLEKGVFEKTPDFNKRVETERLRVENINLTIDKEYAKLLKKHEQKIVKIKKEHDKKLKNIDKKYEKDLVIYNSKVDKEKQRVISVNKQIDKDHQLSLNKYETKIEQQKQKLKNAKQNIPTILSNIIPDIINANLGFPKIEAFEKLDLTTYNADDEMFATKIVSNKLSLPVVIQIPINEAQKLAKNKQLKKIKPIIYFEYANDKLYINNIKAVYKKQEFIVMPQLKEYKPEFKLKEKVADIKFTWSKDYKVKDKKFLVSYKAILEKAKLAKQKAKRLVKFAWKDPDTKLIWLKKIPKDEYNWDDAKQYCEDLTLGGYSDWKLPSRDELKTILTKEPFKNKNSSIKKTYIKKPLLKSMDMKWQYFWSSSEYKEDSSKAWLVIFDNGNDDWYDKTNRNFVRCVRQRQ